MPKCPYCSEELRIKLTGVTVSEIDDEYLSLFEETIQQMPRFIKIAFKSRKDQLQKYPQLVNLLVCSYCDTVISAKIQTMRSV